jgi:hypothetical protein
MKDSEIFQWLQDQKYQTDRGEEGYLMYFDLDMPKILRDFLQFNKNSFTNDEEIHKMD